MSRKMNKILNQIGQPKLVRKTIMTESSRGGDFSEETRTQIVIAIPSNVFESSSDLERFFQSTICAEINRIHREMTELEVTGRICDFVIVDRCNGR